MLAKKYRICKKKEIDGVFKNGRSSFDNILGIKYVFTGQPARFVVVVSTKVSKKAVIRNKLKRRLSEIAKMSSHELLKSGDFFVLALPAAKEADFSSLKKSFAFHLKRLKTVN